MPIYRRDIDGLRAVAIVPVVLFHADIRAFSGGFVGVDVFFVISGYLITGAIAKDLGRGTFSFLDFYERRARRILPALCAMLLATCAASCLILFPFDLRDLGKSLAAAALFSSNILFAVKSDNYFDTGVRPLLHTWSLSVEEQFYLVWPLFLVAAFRTRWPLRHFIAGVTAASLAAAVWATARMPVSAYYLAPFRIWELGLGAYLAVGHGPVLTTARTRNGAGVVGLLLILIPVCLYTRETPYPGLYTLAPCLGAAILLYVGNSGPNAVSRLLSLPPFVFLGLVSFSLYLWHWPLIELYGYYTQDEVGTGATIGLLLASLILAAASWRWIELPFRAAARRTPALRRPFAFSRPAAALAAFTLVGGGLYLGDGWPQRFPPRVIAQQMSSLQDMWDECLMDAKDDRRGIYKSCIRGRTGPIHVAVIGDSHALALLPGIVAEADAARQRVIFFGHGGCPPALGVERIDGYVRNCGAFVRWALSSIGGNPDIRTVVFVSRLSAYVEGSNFGPAERHLPRPTLTRSGAESVGSNEVLVTDGVLAAVSAMRRAGKEVVLVYPVPEVGRNVPAVVAREALRGGKDSDVSLDEAQFWARSRRAYRLLDHVALKVGAVQLRPEKRLCRGGRCRLALNGMPLYKDSNHLSVAGAYQVGPLFANLF